MKTPIRLLMLLVLYGLVSCETEDSITKKESYLEYLKDKSIIAINIQGDTKYIFTSRYCDTCYVAPQMSYIPTIEEWTIIKDSSYENFSPVEFIGLPHSDSKGNLYTAKGNKLYKLNVSGEYELLLNTGDYYFSFFTFDKQDNIWFYGENNGIAFWDKSELKVYNSKNSELPTDRIHGLAVDNSGIVWITLDFKGLLKIESGNWIIIPNSEIPGLSEYSYLRGPIVDNTNNIWFEVFSPDTTSNVLRLENNIWIYEFPDKTKYCDLKIDSKGMIWAISNHYEISDLKYTTLKFYSSNSWIDFDISDIDTKILSVNADNNKVYIGTIKGLIEKTK
jgi:hypothetical protein